MRGLFEFPLRRCRFTWAIYASKHIQLVKYANETPSHNINMFYTSRPYQFKNTNQNIRTVSTNPNDSLNWKGPLISETLIKNLEASLQNKNFEEAWIAFNDYKRSYGFPDQSLLNAFITSLSYSSSINYLNKAYDTVFTVFEAKPGLLKPDPLTRLALSLARAGVPVHAANVLYILLETGTLPSIDLLCAFFLHLVKTKTGSFLATNLFLEICEVYLKRVSLRKKTTKVDSIKPNATLFNLILDSCLKFGYNMKFQEVIESISKMGCVADLNTIILISRFYEKIGRRDELKNLKEKIDWISLNSPFVRKFREFYDCLLSLHFKFNDFNSAEDLLGDLYQRPKFINSFNNNNFQKLIEMQIGSSNLKSGFTIMIDLSKLDEGFVLDLQNLSGLIEYKEGRLVPSEKALAKLVYGFFREKNVSKLSSFFIKIQKGVEFEDLDLCFGVIKGCIEMGWLDFAHDIIENLELENFHIKIDVYKSLLSAYKDQNYIGEYDSLLTHVKNIHGDSVFVEISNRNSIFVEFLSNEASEENLGENHLVYKLNNSICFFCNAKMMDDAFRTYKSMRERNISPNLMTFCNILSGFSSLKMHREITILWGEIKRNSENILNLKNGDDFFECLVLNFLKGGYFERVMEIIGYMSKNGLCCDKWKYRTVFLELHKDLFRNLKSLNAKNEAQSRRLEHVRAFRVWAGIKQK